MLGKVCVVTVTYGDRVKLLNQVVSNLIYEEKISNIVIVNNGSDLSKFKYITERNKIIIINFNENMGSAHGFNEGLAKALELDSEYIFTIDDDNILKKNSIDKFIMNYTELVELSGNRDIALLGLRDDRKDFKLVANGKDPKKVFRLHNSFLGWHLRDIPIKLLRKISNSSEVYKHKKLDYVKVPLAPYGGLFFKNSLLKKIGLPDKSYFLYCDDYDFTYRITKNGGSIFLIPTNTIIDIDKSWFVKEKSGFFNTFLKSSSKSRVLYGVRNRTYFQSRNLVDNKFVYYLNKKTFLFILYIFSLKSKERERYKMIKNAICKGDKGILGRDADFL